MARIAPAIVKLKKKQEDDLEAKEAMIRKRIKDRIRRIRKEEAARRKT